MPSKSSMIPIAGPHIGSRQTGAPSLLGQMPLSKNGLRRCPSSIPSPLPSTLKATERLRAVQAAKRAISHAKDDLKSIQSCVANLNHDQRVDGSGSATELFLQWTTRVPGLAHHPTKPGDVDKLRAAHASSRNKQVKRTQKQRKPEVFVRGQQVLIQNNISKLWNIRARVLSWRSHQGILTNSYVVCA